MGTIERVVKKRVQRVRIQNAILLSLYGAGALSLMLAAPNSVRLMRTLDPYLDRKLNPSRRMQQAISRLVARGLVGRPRKGGRMGLALTAKGTRVAKRLKTLESIQIHKPLRWDKRWRIVIFDVWERRKYVRERLRGMLIKMGFKRVQDSVWAHPYDCEELIAFIRTDLRLGRGVLYLVADAIEGERELRKHFNLPQD